MDNLPEDFKKNYYNNLMFRLKFYFNLTPLFTEDGKYIEIYEVCYKQHKQTIKTKFVFNKLTSNYEYNGHRFLRFNDLLEAFNREFIQSKIHIDRDNL